MTNTPTLPLAGQGALITGGGTGIGYACAKALAEAGASVTVMGRRLDTVRDAARSLAAHTVGDAPRARPPPEPAAQLASCRRPSCRWHRECRRW